MLNDAQLFDLMSRHVTDGRLEKILEVSAQRTKYITLAAEDLYYSQNASALLRSCECFGIQDVHFLENYNKLPTINRHVALGTTRWLTIHRHREKENNTAQALQDLKDNGYRIIATVPPGPKAVSLPEFDLSKGKAAFIFGNERDGVSPLVKEAADEFLTIPMAGFAESFNISVSVAVTLYELTQRLRTSDIPWKLTDNELTELRLDWVRRTANRANEVEEEYHRRFRKTRKSTVAEVVEKDIPVGDQA